MKTPATPLPWTVRGDNNLVTVWGPRKDGHRDMVDQIPLESWEEDAPRLRKDLEYAFWAANKLPAVVEALRVLVKAGTARPDAAPDWQDVAAAAMLLKRMQVEIK